MSDAEPPFENNDTRDFGIVPAGTASLNPQTSQIITWLYAAARDAGRAALSSYARQDRRSQLQAAIAVGGAAEYLGRAVLANHDPALLARRDSHPSLVMLSRANSAGPLDSKTLRTIDANSVWILLELIDTKLKIRTYADTTANVRNSAAHMALVDSSTLEAAVIALTAIVSALHPFLGSNESDFWGGDLTDVVQVLKDVNSNAIQRAVSALIAQRRAQLDSLLADLDVVDRQKMLIFLRARDVAHVPPERHVVVDQVCPACQDDGVATFAIEEGEPEPSYREKSDGDWAEYSWNRELYPYALEFNCPVCGLHLDGTEFDAAGIPSELGVQVETVDDPSLDWEPDEDWARDR